MVNLVTYITTTSTRKHNNIEELFLMHLYYRHILYVVHTIEKRVL